jgi:hypothetical protein
MRKSAKVACGIVTLFMLSSCGLQPDPPPHFDPGDFTGTGTEMAKCMQYASESYCEREIWGGNEN